MKNIKKIVTSLLAMSMIFTFVACGNKVGEIDEDDFMDALEEYLDWEEDEDYFEYEDIDNPESYKLDCYVYGNSKNIEITYGIFSDEDDAEEYFADRYRGNPPYGGSSVKHYSEGEYGYYIVNMQDTDFEARYYYGDMIIEVHASGEDNVAAVKKLLKSFKLPVKS